MSAFGKRTTIYEYHDTAAGCSVWHTTDVLGHSKNYKGTTNILELIYLGTFEFPTLKVDIFTVGLISFFPSQ